MYGQSISALRIPTAFAAGGGTNTTGYPYAVYVQISNWASNMGGQALIKLYNNTNNEYMLSATGAWSNGTAFSNTNMPQVDIDAGGNWSGWIYAKHNDAITGSVILRTVKVGATTTRLTSGSYSFTSLNMSIAGTGGWLVRATSPAVNKGILAYSGGAIVGSYRTEDNGIVEGYAYGAGGFMIAVPVGIVDSLVSVNDDNSRDQVFVGPWSVQAGEQTDASVGSATIGKGSAAILPSVVAGGVSQAIALRLYSPVGETLFNARAILPSIWSWSHLAGDLTLTGGGAPTDSIAGDTVIISGMTLVGGDSLTLQIANCTPPDSTDRFQFTVLTGGAPDSVNPISSQPRVLVHGTPKPIASVKTNDTTGVPLLLGKYVTVRGVVTVSNQFGGPTYIQDNTAGIALYDSAVSNNVNVGDEIVVVGTISPFNGLCELGNPLLLEVTSTGNPLSPLVVTASQVKNDGAGGVENYEGLLVRMNAVVVTDTFNVAIPSWTVAGSGTNYRLTDASGYIDIRVDNNVNFANTPAPQSAFDVIGVVSQFKSASPFIGGYQLMPRFAADIMASGPLFASLPVESNITPTSFRITWTTVSNGTSRLRYGTTTSYELGVLAPDNLLSLPHAVDVSGLQPATIYHVQAFSVSGPDTSTAGDLVVSTASPASVSGQINVYFNKTVDTTAAIGEHALASQDLVARFLTRIDNARRSIDLALYSLSGSSQGDVIANHVVAARNRGVSVRVIGEHDNRSYSGFQILSANSIPMIDDAFDAVGGGQGLMHNKFAVFDYRGGAPESVWVWGGSWNPTFEGTTSDRQNSIEIQDQALAGAYTVEFNQMWGSSTQTPNASASRFGARKSDITPHNFVVNGVPVSLYFSPSDHTTSHIASTLARARHSVSTAILTFTRKDLADTVIQRKNSGDKTRVVMDNNSDTGNQFAYLQSNGIDVHLKGGSGLLHHKYAVVDGDQNSDAAYLVTGSHNWSNSAENSNDENTLILTDHRTANLYLQEFAARYYEAGGTDSFRLSVAPSFALSRLTVDFGTIDSLASRNDSVTVTNGGSATLSISSVVSTNPHFVVSPSSASVPAAASAKFFVTFTARQSQPDSAYIVFSHNAPGSPDSLLVHGKMTAPASTVAESIRVSAGWNMISLPVALADRRKTILFPDAISPAFSYQGSYVTDDTLEHGKGYWLKFGADDTLVLNGMPVLRDTIDVALGWNLIGVISRPIATAGIASIPPAIVQSHYFGYGGSYVIEDTLMPFWGYWVKANPAGKLILAGASAVPKPASTIDMQKMNSITVTDASGHRGTIYFGTEGSGEVREDAFALPPLPPEGGFDVRFASGKYGEFFPKSAGSAQFPIAIRSGSERVNLEWSIDSQDSNVYTLGAAGAGSALRLTGKGSMSVDASRFGSMELSMSGAQTLPTEFSLGQNFPNPFNPVTTVPFGLPVDATVTLTVYNILGEAVATPVRRQLFGAGNRTATIDASGLPSGVYYYRIEALPQMGGNAFTATKKFIVLK